jgi:hypothetical protein
VGLVLENLNLAGWGLRIDCEGVNDSNQCLTNFGWNVFTSLMKRLGESDGVRLHGDARLGTFKPLRFSVVPVYDFRVV